MVYASQWYSIISIASSSLALLTSAYVVRKIPNRRAGDTFVMAMLFFVLAGTFAYLLRTSTIDVAAPYPGPLTIARLFYFFHMLAVGFTASFIGQYFLGFELMRRRLVNLFLQVSLLVVAIGVTVQVNTLRVEADYTYGYYGDVSTGNIYGVVIGDVWARASLALFATIFMSTALAVLIRTLIRNKDPIVRKQTLLMTAGVVTHGIGAEWYATTRDGLPVCGRRGAVQDARRDATKGGAKAPPPSVRPEGRPRVPLPRTEAETRVPRRRGGGAWRFRGTRHHAARTR